MTVLFSYIALALTFSMTLFVFIKGDSKDKKKVCCIIPSDAVIVIAIGRKYNE